METALIFCKWVHYATAMSLFGGSLFRLLLGSGAAGIDRPLSAVFRISAALAFLSAIAWLMLEAANMGDGWREALDPPTVWLVLSGTSFGHVWAARLVLLVSLPVAAHSARRVPLAALSAVVLGSLGLAGHAVMEEGVGGFLHVANQIVHLLAGGAWIGALLPLWLTLRIARPGTIEMAAEAGRRFAFFGTVAVALVVASGIVDGLFLVGGVSDLVTTAYGLVLLAKLALVGGMLLCAALNRLVFVPKLTPETDALMWIRRSVTAEIGLGLMVLAAASLLGTMQPPL